MCPQVFFSLTHLGAMRNIFLCLPLSLKLPQVKATMAFMLPHEVLQRMAAVGDPTKLQETGGLDRTSSEHLHKAESATGWSFVPLTLWGDGVPYNWDRSRSIECWVWSLPGQTASPWKNLRIPFVAFPAELMGSTTQNEILEVFVWSLHCLFLGKWPVERHDKELWQDSDSKRKSLAGSELPLRALLVSVKGDWKQMANVFSLPRWSPSPQARICWRCKATTSSLLETGCRAAWTKPGFRLDHWGLILEIQARGKPLSAIFASPFFDSSLFRIDWLHAVDKGIAAFFLGSLFDLVVSFKDWGPNIDARCSMLWHRVQVFYRQHKVADRLNILKPSMFREKASTPELSAGAAEVRALVPFAKELVDGWGSNITAEMATCKEAMGQLHECYTFLSEERQTELEAGGLLTAGLAFHDLVVSLHKHNPARWGLRPKMHIFLELCREGSRPSLTWNYREESFGGSIARQSHQKGGKATAFAMTRGTLLRFCIREQFPRVV